MPSGFFPVSVALVAAFAAASAGAHPLTRQECSEGSDFIKNAALSRDNGVDGMAFLSRAIDDIAAIKSFPPALRWFVQDERDEDFLLKAISSVFSEPLDPQSHQREFMAACLQRSAAID
jgi:hypothetical protein